MMEIYVEMPDRKLVRIVGKDKAELDRNVNMFFADNFPEPEQIN